MGACTSAGWSPDGRWMYFTAAMQGQSHIWRQRFPQGQPEELTFGPAEEAGVAVEPNGRALITSVGVHESSLWIHDGQGDRQLSSEGEVAADLSPQVFGPDDRALYYLLRPEEGSAAELWRTQVDSDGSDAVFPGISMTSFDLSADGKEVVYTTAGKNGTTELWLAPTNLSAPARKLGVSGAKSPRFGSHGRILFERAEGDMNYLEAIDADGSRSSRVLPYPIEDFQSVSPNGRWVVAAVPAASKKDLPSILAIPLDGGTAQRICAGYCFPRWSMNGKFLFVPVEDPSRSGPGRSLAIPLGPAQSLADLPAGGIAPLAKPNAVPGSESVGRAFVIPGKDAEHYAWVNTSVHRNLYRISLP